MNIVQTAFGNIHFDRDFLRRFYNFSYSSIDVMQRHIVFSLLHKETRDITEIKTDLLAEHKTPSGMVLLSPYGAVYLLAPLQGGHWKMVWMEDDELM